MDIFLILQLLFDAVLLFGILFLFHFSVHQSKKKKEEWDILKDAQIQEIRENLQELLMTLKQLGKEVSENIQDQVREAEEKTESFKKTILKLNKDFQKLTKLAEAVGLERTYLEEKLRTMEASKKVVHLEKAELQTKPRPNLAASKNPENLDLNHSRGGFGFPTGLVGEVYRLYDSKAQMSDIIQKTKLSRAEIQLILNLRNNGFTATN
jgi:chromosome segregation ATPase